MTSLKHYNVLLIEDDEDVLKTFSRILEILFNKVFYLENPIEAFELLENSKIDLIITDLKMPKMNGFEFIEKLNELNYKIPVIVTTCFTDNDTIEKANSLGVKEYITKPININDLIASCENVIK